MNLVKVQRGALVAALFAVLAALAVPVARRHLESERLRVRLRNRLVRQSAPVLRPPDAKALAYSFPGDSRTTLESGEMTLFAVGVSDNGDPTAMLPISERPRFHNWVVTGQARLTEAEKRFVLDSLYDAISAQAIAATGPPAGCFFPHHGIRSVDRRTGKWVDLLICFGCSNGAMYRGNAGSVGVDAQDDGFWAFGPAAQYHMDRLFLKYNVPLAL
ncbi:MAG: hypothetical protein H7145_18345 [Akkermansiaceae bacterium]|nr:hypothetical protein [Armatimonadota bacterium]